MIPISAAKTAISVAQEFDKRGLLLNAVQGTPLACINDTISLRKVDIAGSTGYEPDHKCIFNQSNNWSDDEHGDASTHTTTIDVLSKEIAGHVQSHLNFAKNTARPLIEELVNEIKSDIEALPVNTEYNMEVSILDLPEPMVISSFEEAIMEYKNTDYYAITNYLSLPTLSAPEIIERLNTGHSATDKAIGTWAAKLGDEFFSNVWSCVFTSTPTSSRFENLIKDECHGVDAAIAVYLLAAKMYDNPIEGADVSLSAFNKAIAEIRNQAALRLVHAYDEFVRFKTTGLLIKNVTATKVTVFGETYRKWLEDGGTNAVLFGCVLSSNSEKFAADINAKKQDYMKVWERQNWMLTTADRNKRFVYYKDILKNNAIKLVMNNFAKCYGHLRNDGSTDSTMPEYIQFQSNLDEYLSKVQESWFQNLWKLSQGVVCDCLFYYTSAGKILGGIEKACEENKGIEIREAVLLSTISYVTDYVCDQMVVSSC
jgi:hypothetical protein